MGTETDRKVLYDDGKIKITTNPKSSEEHYVCIGEDSFYLGRGVLRELAASDERHTKISLDALTQNTLFHSLGEADVTLDRLRVAFAQARIKELNDEVGYFVAELRRYRNAHREEVLERNRIDDREL